ncbi:hypothetical protein BDZ85DRAFT_263411 [Elsinoe ampelina]|uniref:Uncharacterized protein n=1 Tax=Elsinoe ampelina TaxID=302913 RepID=A0A6A6GAA6_9PEZI|nr:hypothetical protein BDZ85DRAFT_263411 [Elsinoe ampelina]
MPRLVFDSEEGSSDELFLDVNGSGVHLDEDLDSLLGHGAQLSQPDATTHFNCNLDQITEAKDANAPLIKMSYGMAGADLFDIESTFSYNGAADKAKSKKRRQTAGEIAESPRKRFKESTRSQSTRHSDASIGHIQASYHGTYNQDGMMNNEDPVEALEGAKSLATQAARENVLMLPSSGDMGDDGEQEMPDATIKFATGEQQFMVEEALRNAVPGVYEQEEDTIVASRDVDKGHGTHREEHVSSNSSGSIPWSAEPIRNTQTPSTGSKKRTQSSRSAKSSKSAKASQRTASAQVTPAHGTDMSSSQVSLDELSIPAPEKTPAQRSRTRQISVESIVHYQESTTPRPSETTETDTSAAVPLEQYKAKPSRSRSAAIEYTPTDWSVPPEKLAKKQKSKRTKTAGAVGNADSQLNHDADEQLQIEAEIARRAKEAREEDSSGTKASTAANHTDEVLQDVPMNDVGPAVTTQPKAKGSKKTRKDSGRRASQSQSSPSRVKESIPEQYTEEDAMAAGAPSQDKSTNVLGQEVGMPVVERPSTTPAAKGTVTPPILSTASPAAASQASAPTPTPNSMPPPASIASLRRTKNRRSHTTIFEDHVGLRGQDEEDDIKMSEPTSLKQQQETRKKRGRPRKQPAPEPEPELKPIEIGRKDVVMQNAPVPVPDEEEPPQEATKKQPKTTPAKRGRGRPRKSQVQEVQETQEEVTDESPDVQQEKLTVAPAEEEEDLFASMDAAKEAEADRDEEVQKMSDVGTGKENGTIAAARTAAACKEKQPHSPIKKGVTIYRVGLSRKQRIQPLLKMTKR